MTDHAHTPWANEARHAKARKLAQLAWMRGWAFITGADPDDLRDLRLELHMPKPSDESWALAHDYLTRAREQDTPPAQLTPRPVKD